MNTLFFNLLRRAIIFPLIIVILIGALITYGTSKSESGTAQADSKAVVNIDEYSPGDYNSFSDIKAGNYALTLNKDGSEYAVLYDNLDNQSDISRLFYLDKTSTEPWNNGCVKIMSDSWYQINRLLDVKVGDSLEADFLHGNDERESDVSTYSYKVKEIKNGQSANYLKNFDDSNTMLICASYDNLSDNNQKFYYVIVAEQGDLV